MIVGALIFSAAISASPYRPLPADNPVSVNAPCPKGQAAIGTVPGEGVANLPFAKGRRFRTLDAYLEFLRCHAAPIDQPWWREVRPGVYEHVKRMPGAKREVATRAELMKRFGFSS